MKKINLLLIVYFIVTSIQAQTKSKLTTHTGFYLSGSIGPSFGDINAIQDGSRIVNVSGQVLGMDIQIGNAIRPNLILHGTVKVQTVISPKINSTKFPDSYSFDESFFGAGITQYTPNNFFGTANIGMAYYTFSIPPTPTSFQARDVSTDPGFSFNLKVGKEWPISNKWGLGATAFFSRTALTNKDKNSTEKWDSNRFGICFYAALHSTKNKRAKQ